MLINTPIHPYCVVRTTYYGCEQILYTNNLYFKFYSKKFNIAVKKKKILINKNYIKGIITHNNN